MQRRFRIAGAAAAVALVGSLLAAHAAFIRLPNRAEQGVRSIEIALRPVRIGSTVGFNVAAAYRLSSPDERFGGISGLAVDGDHLLAVTDGGVVARFRKPEGGARSVAARIADLPGGPGPPWFKSGRDAEALAGDPRGRGWWVAFERRDELWLYDPGFTRPLHRFVISGMSWPNNRGLEGLIAAASDFYLFPEGGGKMLVARGGRAGPVPLHGIGGSFPWSGWVSEAALLPDGLILLVERRLSPLGFSNALLLLEQAEDGYRVARRVALPLARTDNVEAVAVDQAPDGKARLWLMTDNDHRPLADTLLMAIDLAAD